MFEEELQCLKIILHRLQDFYIRVSVTEKKEKKNKKTIKAASIFTEGLWKCFRDLEKHRGKRCAKNKPVELWLDCDRVEFHPVNSPLNFNVFFPCKCLGSGCFIRVRI